MTLSPTIDGYASGVYTNTRMPSNTHGAGQAAPTLGMIGPTSNSAAI